MRIAKLMTLGLLLSVSLPTFRSGQAAPPTFPKLATPFIRGDAEGDGDVDFIDAFRIAELVLLGMDHIACHKAADANDDGWVDIDDYVAIVSLFELRDPPPLPPPVDCGHDPTPDDLTCVSSDYCAPERTSER